MYTDTALRTYEKQGVPLNMGRDHIKGTVIVILSAPSMQRRPCQIHNGTL